MQWDNYVYCYFLPYKYITTYKKETNNPIFENKYFKINGKDSLGLSKILEILKQVSFKHIYITGCTFYSEASDIKKNYMENYMIKQGLNCNLLSRPGEHDLKGNIDYFNDFYNNNKNKIEICQELKKYIVNI
jgi:hypothetical protein